MLPVKPSRDDDVDGALEQLAALDVARRSGGRVLGREQLVRLERELVALLRLLADREQPHLGLVDVEDLLGEDGAHVRELEQVLGARVGVRAAVEQHRRRRAERRDRDRDRGPEDAGDAAQVRAGPRRASRRCSRPRRPRRRGPRRRRGRRRRASCPACARTASAGFSSMPIASAASTSSSPWVSSPGGPKTTGLDRRRPRPRARPRRSPRAPGPRPARRPRRARHARLRSRACRAARRRGRGTSCSSGRRGAAASAGGSSGTRSRAATRACGWPGACRGAILRSFSWGLPQRRRSIASERAESRYSWSRSLRELGPARIGSLAPRASCGSVFRSRAADRAEARAVGAAQDLAPGARARARRAPRRRGRAGRRRGRASSARRAPSGSSAWYSRARIGRSSTASARQRKHGPCSRTSEREVEDDAAVRARGDVSSAVDRLGHGEVALAGELDRLQLDLHLARGAPRPTAAAASAGRRWSCRRD